MLQFLCNFSSIDQKRAGGGLRGELIDLEQPCLWDRGTGCRRMKAQSGKCARKKEQEEKMVANGREWLIDLGQGPVSREKRLREKWDEARRS